MNTKTINSHFDFGKFLRFGFLLVVGLIFGNFQIASAQFTFNGDYDKTFASPQGYYVDPQQPDPSVNTYQTTFAGGALLPDGSIIAGGRHVDSGGNGDFYLRKFTPSGAVDAAFGTNGFVRANFFTGFDSGGQPYYSTDIPLVVKVQPDGKILMAGQCNITSPYTGGGGQAGTPYFGWDGCVMRFNADGSVDASFGNSTVMTGGGINGAGQQNPTYTFPVGEGRFMTQTGIIDAPGNPGPRRGTHGVFHDMTLQPDGKILLVGETRNEYASGATNALGAIIVRLNQNGTLDFSFGANGIVNMAANPVAPNCYPSAAFHGVAVQPDGRIIAVGYNQVIDTADCGNRRGNRFMVTRWTANGQAETMRHLDSNTVYDNQNEGGAAVLLYGDGNKILVSGTYNNLTAGSPPDLPTLVRFNLSDLSIDTSFGTNGISQYNGCGSVFCGFTTQGRLYVKAIQPDGKIIGRDEAQYNTVRFNENGSPDMSFGNRGADGSVPGRGRLELRITHYNNVTNPLDASDILIRPNGRINLIGQSFANAGAGELRAVVSQQNTSFTGTFSGDVAAGTNVSVTINDVGVVFSNVSSAGTLAATTIDPNSAGSAPNGYTIPPEAPAYDITTTAAYTSPIDVCLVVPNVNDPNEFAKLHLLHGENGVLVDRTISQNFNTRTVCARVNSLSPFVIAVGPAIVTASTASVGGRVRTNLGKAIPNARISMTDETGNTLTAITNRRGIYNFESVETGRTYVLTVKARGYRFINNPTVVSVNENLDDIDFVAIR